MPKLLSTRWNIVYSSTLGSEGRLPLVPCQKSNQAYLETRFCFCFVSHSWKFCFFSLINPNINNNTTLAIHISGPAFFFSTHVHTELSFSFTVFSLFAFKLVMCSRNARWVNMKTSICRIHCNNKLNMEAVKRHLINFSSHNYCWNKQKCFRHDKNYYQSLRSNAILNVK